LLKKNRLRELLEAGKPSLGTRLHSMWPTITELVGQTGLFDYVEILAEYAPFDLFGLENIGRAIELHGMTGVVKVGQEAREFQTVKALNAGIQNVLFADVRTVEIAERCVKAVRAESPETKGLRGVGQGRDVGVTLEAGSPFYVHSTADSVVLFMIEKKEAIENLESILDVEGVDMVQFGPADYSMSIGQAGNRQHPAVGEAEEYMIKTALKKGITPRAEPGSAEAVKRYMEMGVRHFCMGTDVRILFDWYRETGSQMRDILTSI
jgi:2-keto-3-deoxy-L-rhamnonate aldolase RhmA